MYLKIVLRCTLFRYDNEYVKNKYAVGIILDDVDAYVLFSLVSFVMNFQLQESGACTQLWCNVA